MKIGQQINFIVINKQANSLYSLIADGQYRATFLGRNSWKTLIGSSASLQFNCNKEGFNVMTDSYRAKSRIGILSNQENDCFTPDSRIGFGTGGYPDDFNTCGNAAAFYPDNGDKNIKAMGYILVQWQRKQSKFREQRCLCSKKYRHFDIYLILFNKKQKSINARRFFSSIDI